MARDDSDRSRRPPEGDAHGPDPLITGTDFITVATKDFDAAAAFYTDVLGLPMSKRWGETIDSGFCCQAFFADPDGNALAIHHRYAA